MRVDNSALCALCRPPDPWNPSNRSLVQQSCIIQQILKKHGDLSAISCFWQLLTRNRTNGQTRQHAEAGPAWLGVHLEHNTTPEKPTGLVWGWRSITYAC